MDTGCSSPRQQQQHHHHPHPHHHHHSSPTAAVIVVDRPPARGASSGTPSKLTPSQGQAVALLGVQNQTSDSRSLYIVCSRCGQISHDLSKCDFCSRPIAATDKVKQRTNGPKRRIILDSTSGGGSGSQLQPTEAKISKHTFYGSHAMAATVVGNDTLRLVQPSPAVTSNNTVLLAVRPAVTTNGQARPLLSLATTQLVNKPTRTVATANRRGRKEPECLTIAISSDEEADGEGSLEECPPQRSVPCEAPTKENHGALRPAAAEVQCLTVQETPPQSPRSGRGGVMVLSSPTSSDSSRGSGTGASSCNNPGVPLASTTMRFSCRSIRVGSYKVASGEHWVTVSSRGFEFSIPPLREGPDVLVRLSNTNIVQVLGHLSCLMPVLFVTTSQECSVEVCTKLGMNRKYPGYFDPRGPEENQKRITFLPEPPFSEDQKAFLRQVFPGPLLQEITQKQATKVLINSSPSPLVAVTLVQETPPRRPHSGSVGVRALFSAMLPEVSRGPCTEASCSPGTPLANTVMRFSCHSIRVGSYKVAFDKHWVTASSQGFEFSIPPLQEGPDVLVRLSNTDIVEVLGHLMRFQPVLFVTTSQECSVEVRTKLGMNRKQPGYFDPSGPEENQKRITFLPEPPFMEDKKTFLRQVYPGPLLQEITEEEAIDVLLKSSPTPLVQGTPPRRPHSGSVGVRARFSAMLPEVSQGPCTEASCSPGTPLANKVMLFSCRSIRVGSYKVASGEHWVIASSQGFEFSIPPLQEGPDVLVHLSNTDIVQVLGHLKCFMPVLFVTTSQECSAEVRAKLGMNRKQPEYFDPSGPEEDQKQITFLPEPPFTEDQKIFLRQVFPGPLLQEMKQTQANEILVKSTPSLFLRKQKDVHLLFTPLPKTPAFPLASMADLGDAQRLDGSCPHSKKARIRL